MKESSSVFRMYLTEENVGSDSNRNEYEEYPWGAEALQAPKVDNLTI
jgi:hypothetical protein